MDEHRVTGTAKNLGGKIEEGFGRIAGDVKSQVQGQVKQVQGTAEDLYGQAKDAAGDFTDIVRNTIETRPYTAVAIAVALGAVSAREDPLDLLRHRAVLEPAEIKEKRRS
jgi:uncharacterized protein YjbJ (UPF0337 family)